MEGIVALVVLAIVSIPLILPLISWLIARKVRARVDDLEARVAEQDERIQRLTLQLSKLKETGVASASAREPESELRRDKPAAAAAVPPPPRKVSEPIAPPPPVATAPP